MSASILPNGKAKRQSSSTPLPTPVAKDGRWTNGPLPFGYTADSQHCLTPSLRQVPELAMAEADVVRDLYKRVAHGSSTVAEARRLTALGVSTTRYYSNGTPQESGKKWYAHSIGMMMARPVYRGIHVIKSRFGPIEREVTALVDQALWEQANAQIKRNQHLPSRGRIPATAVEAQLDEIAREEAELRQQCSVLETQKALAEGFEAHLTDTRHLLQRLQGRLEEVEQTNDQSTKREVIELLVHGVRVDTDKDRKISVTITYAFRPERVAYPCVSAHSTRPGGACHTYDVQ